MNRFRILDAASGVQNGDAFVGLDPFVSQQFLRCSHTRSAFWANECAFDRSHQRFRRKRLFVRDRDRTAIRFVNSFKYQQIADGMRDCNPERASVGVFPKFRFPFSGSPGADDRGAANDDASSGTTLG